MENKTLICLIDSILERTDIYSIKFDLRLIKEIIQNELEKEVE